jgi:hypothetical protein
MKTEEKVGRPKGAENVKKRRGKNVRFYKGVKDREHKIGRPTFFMKNVEINENMW